jgi:hypothetical protein
VEERQWQVLTLEHASAEPIQPARPSLEAVMQPRPLPSHRRQLGRRQRVNAAARKWQANGAHAGTMLVPAAAAHSAPCPLYSQMDPLCSTAQIGPTGIDI